MPASRKRLEHQEAKKPRRSNRNKSNKYRAKLKAKDKARSHRVYQGYRKLHAPLFGDGT